MRPDLVAEWDYKGNAHLSPEEVSAHSLIKVKWRCNKGHSFVSTVSARNQDVLFQHSTRRFFTTTLRSICSYSPILNRMKAQGKLREISFRKDMI